MMPLFAMVFSLLCLAGFASVGHPAYAFVTMGLIYSVMFSAERIVEAIKLAKPSADDRG
jgi:hypothetical protein